MPLDGRPQDFETPAVQLDEVGQVLMRAADEIRKRGHAKRVQMDADGRICVHGAINLACGGTQSSIYDCNVNTTNPDLARRAAGRLYHFLYGAEGVACAPWNNSRERTPSEVITALENAAKSRIVQP